jgi:hypothetical protein
MSEHAKDLKPGAKAFAVRVIRILLSGFFCLMILTSCESLQDTAFAPAKPVLEPVPGGGAQHFVVVNSSDQTLHNFFFRAYMWDDRTLFYTDDNAPLTPRRLPAMSYSFTSSGLQWEPGRVLRFRYWDIPGEIPILKPVSRVQIVGRCDEGKFRENWQINEAGQLEKRREKN